MLVINRGSLGFENGVEKSPESGIRGSFSDLNASLGLSQLRQFPDFVHRRQWIREEYRSAVGHNVSDVSDPSASFLFRYTLKTNEPFDDIEEFFSQRGVVVKRGVDELLHRRIGLDDRSFPNAVERFRTSFSVPFFPRLSNPEVRRVRDAIAELSDYA